MVAPLAFARFPGSKLTKQKYLYVAITEKENIQILNPLPPQLQPRNLRQTLP